MKPSNIEVQCDYSDFVMFKTTCECSSDNHTLTVIVEKVDNTTPPITSLFFKCCRLDHEIGKSWWQVLWQRIKDACKVLFTGELSLEEEFIFRNQKHLEDFQNTLEEAINQVNNVKE